jgi:hypothetical protein
MQDWKNKMILLHRAMILMNEVMAKALGVPYEPTQLDDSLIYILIFEIKREPKPLLYCYNFIYLCCRVRR